jgi:nucleotide-binding universal stress UspA family protein
MPGWKKILCPIDFSDTSRAAMLQALEIAKRENAQVLLLHVLETPLMASHGELLTPPEMFAGRPEEAQTKLMAWKTDAESIAPGRVITEMLGGAPGNEIPRVAREGGFDLVVMGTHGRRGLRRLALGSVAEVVARTAPCPVLVHRPASRAACAARTGDSECRVGARP